MIDWTAPMNQTYEFYLVDPKLWVDVLKIDTILSGSITFDSDSDTKGSATFDTTQELAECYIRTYLISRQGNEYDRRPLGTFLCQTPETTFDGRNKKQTMTAYTSLVELNDTSPPYGYTIVDGATIMELAHNLADEVARAPVILCDLPDEYDGENFVANLDDTWLTYLSAFISSVNYEFSVDTLGQILFIPRIELYSMQPVFTFDDTNSSILYPSITVSRDLYGMPNVVEVIFSKDVGCIYSRVENNDPDSPISTKSRGREVLYRITDPSVPGTPTQESLDYYARKMLRELSVLEYTITYTHGFVPTVRVGDCVVLNYIRAGIYNVKAKVIRQVIKLEPGCPVEETAVYTEKLWKG